MAHLMFALLIVALLLTLVAAASEKLKLWVPLFLVCFVLIVERYLAGKV